MTGGRGTGATILGMILCGVVSPCLSLAADPAHDAAAIRSGDHPGFGRIIIDANNQARYQLDQNGDHVVVRFTTPLSLGTPPHLPRNVMEMTVNGAVAELTLSPGALVRPARIAGRVVLDVLDASDAVRLVPPLVKAEAPRAKAKGQWAKRTATPLKQAPSATAVPKAEEPPAPAENAAGANRSVTEAAKPPPPVAEPPPKAPAAAPPAPLAADPGLAGLVRQTLPGPDTLPEQEGPVVLAARRIKLPKSIDGSAFLVPFSATTGAAAFREGNVTLIVFDKRRPVDMSALRDDPLFRSASLQMLPGGTLFRIPLPANLSVALAPVPQGWRIAALPAPADPQPIAATSLEGRLNLMTDQPSEVVSMADPETGATLLVGTQRQSGQGVATGRRTAEFILRPTLQGVVVEPISDAMAMQPVKTGFSLSSNTGPLALSPTTSTTAAMINAAHLTRRLDFSTMRTDALVRRFSNELSAAAMSQPMARGEKHHLAAESMVALGFAAEAESMLHVAAEQDPREAASPDNAALTAVAALLAGRPQDADALDDPRLNGTDEIALWRAVRLAMRDEGSPAAAASFAATAPLALLYPPPIRDHILPLIVETMLQGGELAPAVRLLDQRKDDPKLAYARALQRQAQGETDQALDMLDAIAAGHDQFDRSRAAVHAVELRLESGKIDKVQAADALEKLTYAWRGDERELALREHVADLRAQTGAWREALSTLRQAEADFPERANPVHARMKDVFSGMVHSPDLQKIPPIDFVTMIDENADLAAVTGDELGVDQPLADRLLALDLPDRAKPVLRKLMAAATTDVAKARFGATLATIEAREKHDVATLAALDASEGRDLPADLVEQRTLIRAGALARNGDATAATDLLLKLGTLDAAAARAQVFEDAKDWAGAEQAWTDRVAKSFPASGPLDDGQTRTLLRLATATARAGDDAGLGALRKTFDGRVPAGSLGDMFRLLTAEPIRTSQDIQRSKQEVNLAASLPAGLKALQGNAP